MKLLYIFPHPDDESFGPAPAISGQLRQGHEVYLLTLTRGGATKVRHRYGYSVEEMGAVRFKEMQNVEKVLSLSGMTVLDLPDSGLKEMDPVVIEKAVEYHIREIEPDIVITYAVHGISGFHDHLVTYAAVKRVYSELKKSGENYLKRLAFFTITEQAAEQAGLHQLRWSREEEIDCIFSVDEEDIAVFHKALDCYETYRETIEESRIREIVTGRIAFEIYRENYSPPLDDLTRGLL